MHSSQKEEQVSFYLCRRGDRVCEWRRMLDKQQHSDLDTEICRCGNQLGNEWFRAVHLKPQVLTRSVQNPIWPSTESWRRITRYSPNMNIRHPITTIDMIVLY